MMHRRTTLVCLLVLLICQHVMMVTQGLHQAMEDFNPDEPPDENDANELNKPDLVQDAESVDLLPVLLFLQIWVPIVPPVEEHTVSSIHSHIREHLDDSIKFDPETASPDEIEFYFFK